MVFSFPLPSSLLKFPKVLAAERLEGSGEATRSTGHIAKQEVSQNFEQREITIGKLYVYENLSQF